MKSKKIIISLVAVVVLVIIIWLLSSSSNQPQSEVNDQNNNQATTANNDNASSTATSSQEKLSTDYNAYLIEGLKYNAQGDQGDKAAYQKAIDAFNQANKISDYKTWVPYLNLANVYKKMGKYQESEDNYNSALKISNYGESSIYIAKIDLYKYYLKKTVEEISSLYKEGVEKVVENTTLIIDYAAYLKSVGAYSESLKYYEGLVKNFPDNKLYQDEIADLKAKLKK